MRVLDRKVGHNFTRDPDALLWQGGINNIYYCDRRRTKTGKLSKASDA